MPKGHKFKNNVLAIITPLSLGHTAKDKRMNKDKFVQTGKQGKFRKHYTNGPRIIKGEYFLFGTQRKIKMQYFYILKASKLQLSQYSRARFNILD